MSQSSTLYVGMDVHKDLDCLAYAFKTMAPKSSPSAISVRDSVTSINSSVGCNPKARTSSLSMQLARVAMGSTVISPTKARSAGSSLPP
jgi:hypothetical protein